MEALVTLVLSGGDVADMNSAYNFLRTPFIDAFDDDENNGVVRLAACQSQPRTLRTHLPVHFIPDDVIAKQVRTIYVMRDIKDTMVSLYHFCRSYIQLGVFEEDWDSFFELVMLGEVPYGHAIDHYLGWCKQHAKLNMLVISFEDMVSNREDTIKKLAVFLGKDLDEEAVRRIAQASSFESMRANDKVNLAPLSMAIDQTISPFIRKGIIGDWKQHFTAEQLQIFDQRFGKQVKELASLTQKFCYNVL